MSEYTPFSAADEPEFDPITGLPSERAFLRHCERAAQECAKRRSPLGIMALSVDGVEDRIVWYPLESAPLLHAVTRRLRADLRTEYFFSRVGNTFFIVLPGANEERTAALRRRLVEDGIALDIDGNKSEVTACAGAASVVLWRDSRRDLRDCFARSVAALAVARQRGSCAFTMHSPSIEQRSRREKRLERGLRSAMRDDQFLLLYQPIVDVATRKIGAVEALVRWNHPQLGVIGPAEFVPLAQTLALSAELDAWVLERALRDVASLGERGRDVRVHVNMIAEHLGQPEAVEEILQIVDESGVDPRRIVLEITESSTHNGIEMLRRNIDLLREAGLRIAIDDIGSGFNNLAFFVEIPWDMVKIDRVLMPVSGDDERRCAVLEGIMRLCERLGMELVVEGVETELQHALVRGTGVKYAQGYRYAFPASLASLAGSL
jgi:EAL domain-containing protein (putative c-di-GMP-specific phosphodiesterase class I)/GGDEF domain-containing protein